MSLPSRRVCRVSLPFALPAPPGTRPLPFPPFRTRSATGIGPAAPLFLRAAPRIPKAVPDARTSRVLPPRRMRPARGFALSRALPPPVPRVFSAAAFRYYWSSSMERKQGVSLGFRSSSRAVPFQPLSSIRTPLAAPAAADPWPPPPPPPPPRCPPRAALLGPAALTSRMPESSSTSPARFSAAPATPLSRPPLPPAARVCRPSPLPPARGAKALSDILELSQ